MYNLYTIGYSAFTIEKFIDVLGREEINAVVDVRSRPFSRTFPDFNIDTLKISLKKSKVAYVPMCDQLGAQPKDPALYTNGRVDFAKFADSDQFLKGCERLKEGLTNYTICIMCAEKDPLTCHRAILVTHNMKLRYPRLHIYHIQPERIESHSDMEARLCAETSNDQALLMGGDPLEEAYSKRAHEIAYCRDSKNDNEDSLP